MIKRLKKIFIFILFLINFKIFTDEAIDSYNSGKKEYFFENYDSAIKYYKQALEINPNYVDPLVDLSYLYYDIENYDYAYKYIQKALSLIPESIDIIVFSANIETRLRMYDIAEKKYKKILEKDPLNIKAQNGLAYLYLITNKNTLAKKTIDNVLKSDSNNFDAILMSAFYYELIDKKKAENFYIMNIERNSLNPDSFYYYSIFNFENDRIDEAINNIQTSIQIKERSKYYKYLGKYNIFLNKGDEALNIFRKLLKEEKSNYIIYYYLAYCYYIISDYDSARDSLKKTLILRADDEFSAYFLDYILVNNFNVDNEERIIKSDEAFNKAIKAKKESLYDLYVFLLKEAIKVYPKNINARIELAEYFLFLNFPERYIRELTVATKYTDDKKLKDRIEIEKKRISYRLGDDWQVNQYQIEQDIFKIPLFMKKNINNIHYNCEKLFTYILKNSFSEKMKYELMIFDERDYDTAEKIKISREENSPLFIDLNVLENGVNILSTVKLYNAKNKEIIKEYKIIKNGNNKAVNSAVLLLNKINDDMMFKAHIIKVSRDRALINAGRRLGVKLKDKFIILKNQKYNIDFNKTNYIYNSDDIKGYGVVVKLDENIAEIKYNDDDFSPDIDIDDLIIYMP